MKSMMNYSPLDGYQQTSSPGILPGGRITHANQNNHKRKATTRPDAYAPVAPIRPHISYTFGLFNPPRILTAPSRNASG